MHFQYVCVYHLCSFNLYLNQASHLVKIFTNSN